MSSDKKNLSLAERRKQRKKDRKREKRKYPYNISRREVEEIKRATKLILRSVGYEITGEGLRTGLAGDLYYEVELRGRKKANQNQLAFGRKSTPPRLIFEIMYNDPEKMIPEIYSLLNETIEKYGLDLSVHKL
jgi:hypothetical protein